MSSTYKYMYWDGSSSDVFPKWSGAKINASVEKRSSKDVLAGLRATQASELPRDGAALPPRALG